ncbi:uncharacterized protein [Aegilops tauschii subsp. strangulata]|uniref:uncharacterized protein n=1 Tax=Aegilops tauschii subsp. strangulata TaxID=200361 RepID=UPI00098BA8C1|nr:uncharacterized protein LOC109734393 [Aegilops tauschii subsp. strangulata]
MMQVILKDVKQEEEHVLNFKGSIKGHRVLNRNRALDHLTLMADYFAPNALFTDHFHRHFRMRKTVFDRLYHGVWSYDDYFILKKDAMRTRLLWLPEVHARTSMLAYDMTVDSWDKYLEMSESTCGDDMVKFATAMVEVFGPRYLREPTVEDIGRLLAISEARGWPGLLRSLDCMH